MVKASFFSIGLFVLLCGVSLLWVDRVVLTIQEEQPQQRQQGFRGMFTAQPAAQRQKVIDPPDWAAFSLMSVGSVTALYAVALPKNRNGSD